MTDNRKQKIDGKSEIAALILRSLRFVSRQIISRSTSVI
jgi:hypothetical protein